MKIKILDNLDPYSEIYSTDLTESLNATDNKCQQIIKFPGDPAVSPASNLIVKSTKGNSTALDAQVIGLSDYHYDKSQKYLRAKIVNDILSSRDDYDEVIFLVEGTPQGEKPNKWVYETLIGSKLIKCRHYSAGWDDANLNSYGIGLIQKMVSEKSELNDIKAKLRKLNKERSAYLKDTKHSAEEIFDALDRIEAEMDDLMFQYQTKTKMIQTLLNEITATAEERNLFLYQSIRKAIELCPKALIFVVAGNHHFDHISKEMKDLKHCIFTIHSFKHIENMDAALEEVYGKIENLAVGP